jgi:2-(1,2-epoxy-1,2-dihydrophenyl)acetyl-CoA isomerase
MNPPDATGDATAQATAVLLEERGDVLLIRLNRPDRFNAFNQDLHEQLSDAWLVAARAQVRAVVLTGEGRGFCAGADLQQPPAPGEMGHRTLRHTFHPHMLAMASLCKPVIAAVNGAAAGSGLALACAADVRFASTTAKFVPAFSDIGLVPDAGASYFVTRLLGYGRAFAWLAGGERWNAERALLEGLVSKVVAPEDLLAHALAYAEVLAAKPGLSVGLTKGLLARAARASLAEQLEAEAEAQLLAVQAPGRAEARARKLAEISNRPNP